jgi:hypothetical protein
VLTAAGAGIGSVPPQADHRLACGRRRGSRAARLLPVIDRTLDIAFDLDLRQSPVQRGAMLQPPWSEEHSGEGWGVLGAVLGLPARVHLRPRLLGF